MGAVREVRKDMGARRGAVVAGAAAEVERRTYTTAIGDDGGSSEDEDCTPELTQTLFMDEVHPCPNPRPPTSPHPSLPPPHPLITDIWSPSER